MSGTKLKAYVFTDEDDAVIIDGWAYCSACAVKKH